MRGLNKTALVRLSENNINWLKKETNYFEKTIKNGKWSLNDGFTEIIKIIESHKEVKK
jgi:TRAP-type uncharacterized transport system substrate-binding protein